jgi:hypothetical protein
MTGPGWRGSSIGAFAFACACLPKPDPIDSTSDPDDTGAPTDDTGPDDSGTPPGFPLTVLTPGAADDAAVGLFALSDAGPQGNDGTLVAGAAASESVALFLPETPPSEDFLELPIDDEETFSAAVYIPALWADDGNLARDPSEPFLGVGHDGAIEWPIFMEEVPSQFQALGYVAGWNLAQVGYDAKKGDVVVGPNFSGSEITVETNIALEADLNLRGRLDMPDIGSPRITVMPINNEAFPKGTADNEPLYDEVLTDPWAVDHGGGPPEDHYERDEYVAFEFLFAYADVGDEGFGAEDLGSDVGQACTSDQQFVFVVYTLVPDAFTAMSFALFGWQSGWGLYTEEKGVGTTAVPHDEWADLHIGTDCYD